MDEGETVAGVYYMRREHELEHEPQSKLVWPSMFAAGVPTGFLLMIECNLGA